MRVAAKSLTGGALDELAQSAGVAMQSVTAIYQGFEDGEKSLEQTVAGTGTVLKGFVANLEQFTN